MAIREKAIPIDEVLDRIVSQAFARCGVKEVADEEQAEAILREIGRITYAMYLKYTRMADGKA